MPVSFNDSIEADHLNMLSSSEFGTVCLNNRTGESFNVIKTDAYVLIDEQGLPISEDKPMFNTSKKMKNALGTIISTDIKQHDTLTIDAIDFIVRDVRNDGLGGFDIYLKG